jgi:hypothetical protein
MRRWGAGALLATLLLCPLSRPAGAQMLAQTNVFSPNGTAADNFGTSVSVSGNTLVVGAPYKTLSISGFQGAVYVYGRTPTGWGFEAELTAPDPQLADYFGTSVSVSGRTIVVGAPGHGGNGKPGQGAAYIYTDAGTGWKLQAEISAADGKANDSFGYSTAVSGNTVVIGAPDRTVGANAQQGAGYVFSYAASSWQQKAELTASDGASGDAFGSAVSVSGTTIAVGAPYHADNRQYDEGAVYLYGSVRNVWHQNDEIVPTDGASGDTFGSAVSLNGSLLAIGAPEHAVDGSALQGTAYVYFNSNPGWSLDAELTADDGANGDRFGASVGVGTNIVAVGAPGHLVNGVAGQGAAYTFYVGPTFNPGPESVQNDTPLSGALGTRNSLYGAAVAVSGNTVAVGSPGFSTANRYQGQATVLTIASPTSVAPDGAAGDNYGQSVAVSGSVMAIGAPYKTVNSNVWQGMVYLYLKTTAGWQLWKEITAPDGATCDNFGTSISLNNNTLVIGAPYHTTNSGPYTGAVYVYTFGVLELNNPVEITATDAYSGDQFGASVSVYGNTIAVGALAHPVNNIAQGAAYLFSYQGGRWVQQAEVSEENGATNDIFGYSVSLGNGMLAVGAPYHTTYGNAFQGAVYLFSQTVSGWKLKAGLAAQNGRADDFYGLSVSLSGYQLAVGAPGRSLAYLYDYSKGNWQFEYAVTGLDTLPTDDFGYSISLNGSILAVGAPYHGSGNSPNQGTVYLFNHAAQQTELTALDGQSGDRLGTAVSLDATDLVVGAFTASVNGNANQGLAYTLP